MFQEGLEHRLKKTAFLEGSKRSGLSLSTNLFPLIKDEMFFSSRNNDKIPHSLFLGFQEQNRVPETEKVYQQETETVV